MPEETRVVPIDLHPAQKDNLERFLDEPGNALINTIARVPLNEETDIVVMSHNYKLRDEAYLQASAWGLVEVKGVLCPTCLAQGNKIANLEDPMFLTYKGVLYKIILTCGGEQITKEEPNA
jgi:hypothetical protein